jgi:hypothetical protein
MAWIMRDLNINDCGLRYGATFTVKGEMRNANAQNVKLFPQLLRPCVIVKNFCTTRGRTHDVYWVTCIHRRSTILEAGHHIDYTTETKNKMQFDATPNELLGTRVWTRNCMFLSTCKVGCGPHTRCIACRRLSIAVHMQAEHVPYPNPESHAVLGTIIG